MKFRKMNALEVLAERGSMATTQAEFARTTAKNHPESVSRADAKGYKEGQAAAYADAHRIMKAELERLRNLLQNGALSVDDFGV